MRTLVSFGLRRGLGLRLLVVVVLLGGASRADAQRGGAAVPAPTAGERREAIKKRIRSIRAYTLTEELSLDEQTAGKLFPLLAKFDDQTDKLLQRRVELQRQLKAAGSLKDNKLIDRLIDDAIANQKAFRDLEDQRLAELRRFLAPIQTAKILVVLPEFERRIQNRLRQAIDHHLDRPGQNNLHDADDDDDDAARPPNKRPSPPPGMTRPQR